MSTSAPSRLGGFEVDHQLELGRQYDRQITRLLAFEDASGINAGAEMRLDDDETKRGLAGQLHVRRN
jgi:hypothetical protein